MDSLCGKEISDVVRVGRARRAFLPQAGVILDQQHLLDGQVPGQQVRDVVVELWARDLVG